MCLVQTLAQKNTTANITSGNTTKGNGRNASLPVQRLVQYNYTVFEGNYSTHESVKKTTDGGRESLIVICIVIIALSIISIGSFYWNFEVHRPRKRYKKVVEESELVEIDLFESDEED